MRCSLFLFLTALLSITLFFKGRTIILELAAKIILLVTLARSWYTNHEDRPINFESSMHSFALILLQIIVNFDDHYHLQFLFLVSTAQRVQCLQVCGGTEIDRVATISGCCSNDTLGGGAFVIQGNVQCRSCDNFRSKYISSKINLCAVIFFKNRVQMHEY